MNGSYRKRGARYSTSRRASAAKVIQNAARKRAFTKNRGGLKTVRRIQRQPYAPQRIKNTASIATLSRAVKKLQNAKLGEYQKMSEHIHWNYAYDYQPRPFDAVHPLAFCLNQFIDGKDTTGAPQTSPVYFTDSVGNGHPFRRFTKWAHPAFQANQAVNQHWGDDDLVSLEVYKPLGTQVLVEVNFDNVTPGVADTWVRFDIVAPKKMITQTLHHELKMPFGLGQFTCLAREGLNNRNTINPTYWQIKKTIWRKVNNDTGTTKNINFTVKINRSYKNAKPIKCDLDATPAIAGNYPTFDMQVDPRELEWLVLSCGNTPPSDVRILRHCSWRDQHGTAA